MTKHDTMLPRSTCSSDFASFPQKGNFLRIKKTMGVHAGHSRVLGHLQLASVLLVVMSGKEFARAVMTCTTHKGLYALLLAILVSSFASCTSSQGKQYNDYVQTWIGLRTSHLIRVWGAPQHTAQLPDGSSIIEYRERNVHRVAVPVTGRSATPGGIRVENRTSWCVTRFTARNGVVESSSFEGTDCQAP